MKVIFLDIDGVLNNYASLAEGIHLLSDKCKLIDRICNATNAAIVLSSTWRIGHPIDVMNTVFWMVGGAYNAIIDYTPRLDREIRGEEIKQWLLLHPKVTKYVIIDDDSDMLEEQMPFFYKTDMRTGLTTKTTELIISALR